MECEGKKKRAAVDDDFYQPTDDNGVSIFSVSGAALEKRGRSSDSDGRSLLLLSSAFLNGRS